MNKRLEQAGTGAPDELHALLAMNDTYETFAHESRYLFGLMFSSPTLESSEELNHYRRDTLRLIASYVRQAQKRNWRPETDPDTLAALLLVIAQDSAQLSVTGVLDLLLDRRQLEEHSRLCVEATVGST
ncbi:hypothetical protein ACIBI9_65785 [Nonomuraea sp. NPDC050451]|uniref:hypothetical protein n=1 Tax=Nonomuraea sp. NPDC050451 TaxID=3364364 RepID=UPI0037AA99E1